MMASDSIVRLCSGQMVDAKRYFGPCLRWAPRGVGQLGRLVLPNRPSRQRAETLYSLAFLTDIAVQLRSCLPREVIR